MRFDFLMRKALSAKFSPKARAQAFNRLYYDYVKIKGNDRGWDRFREKLRKRYSNYLTEKQMARFGLTKEKARSCFSELKRFVVKKPKSRYSVEHFYRVSWPLIRSLSNKGNKILDIGFGDYPTFAEFLNFKGYSAYGAEPFPKKVDKKISFKGTIKNLPKKLNQKYDIILANFVYSINYAHYFSKKFEWELKNKKILIRKLVSLLNKNGYLILVDDIGTIFSKKILQKYFKVLLFEKDCWCGGRITLLRKRN